MLGALLLIVLFGCLALLLGFSRWLAHRPWAAAGNVTIAVVLFAVAYAWWPAVLHLRTYERIPANGPVAQVYCERTGTKTYRVTLTRLPSGRMQVYEIGGDEWRLDARTLVWKGHARQLGLSPSYRFERLSARYLRSARPAEAVEEMRLPEGFALADVHETGEDIWSQARTGQRWVAELEPGRAYGPWRPLADKARYDVWMSHEPDAPDVRLEARAAGAAAAQAMRYTRSREEHDRTTQG
jgi:membrane protein implicated in regulation of membrane protease activity